MRPHALVGIALLFASSLGAQESSRLRISVIGQAAKVRTTRGDVVAPERDVSLRGIDAELWLRARGLGTTGAATRAGLGFAARAHQSSLGGDDLTYYDVSALYGLGALIERVAGAGVRDGVGDLSAELAIGGQNGFESSSGLAHGEMHSFARVGVRASSRIAVSPLSFELRLGKLLAMGGADGEDALSGFDGETALRWSFTQWPLDAAVGYRFQRFDANQAAQEVSAVRLEVGWRGLR